MEGKMSAIDMQSACGLEGGTVEIAGDYREADTGVTEAGGQGRVVALLGGVPSGGIMQLKLDVS